MRTTVTCIAASLAVLAACSKAPSAGGAGQASTTAAAPAQAPAPSLFSRPHPKAGLWRMAMSNDTGPGVNFTGEVCIDANTEQSAFQAGPRAKPKDCADPKIGPAPGGGIAFDTTCQSSGRTLTSHVVASGDFNSAYSMDVTSSMDPPPQGVPPQMHMHMQATWLGACKPGQAPGHMSMKLSGLGRD